VFAAEHLLDLGAVNFRLKRVEGAEEISGYVFSLFGPLEQHTKIVEFGDQTRAQFYFFAQPPPAL
jgi:hypothetical protein